MKAVLAWFALAAGLCAQGTLLRAVPDQSEVWLDARFHLPDQVVVKFAEGTDIRASRGSLVAPRDLAPVLAVLGQRAVRPFFTVGDEALRALRARVLAATAAGTKPPADLSLYAIVSTRDLDDSRALIHALHALPEVEIAYARERATPPPGDIPPVTPSFTSQQTWQNAAPTGLDAMAARSIIGGWGAGTYVLDVEYGWDFDHEDLAVLRPGSQVGPPASTTLYRNHGTAVCGELAADPDQFGVNGLTPDIVLRVATVYPTTGYSVAGAIVTGLPVLRPKDVILLEAQASSPLGYVATEYVQADFDAIQNATKLGVIVVEAAGNGGANLDSPTFGRRFDLTYRDSGAIIVAATNGPTLFPSGSTCYGSRVDANGWGSTVTTTGFGDLFGGPDVRQHYTSVFGGTSSASAMVTSVVVSLLSAAKAHWSPAKVKSLDYLAIRYLLRTYGTPMSPTSPYPIGRRPDLLVLLRAAGLERGLRVLDEVRIAQSYRLELTADFAAGGGDFWILFAAAATGNIDIGLPSPCGRLTLDPALLFPFTFGTFGGGNPSTVSIAVPNDPSLHRTRLYWQAATVRGIDLRTCLTNGAQAYVMP
ncbi:MAG TPA: S8 family serine peptidase [Planctomycetota bacterium]|nr:S8 family serine peptidase [Planctomycetota bacterium]